MVNEEETLNIKIEWQWLKYISEQIENDLGNEKVFDIYDLVYPGKKI